jgi:hypothetical protein
LQETIDECCRVSADWLEQCGSEAAARSTLEGPWFGDRSWGHLDGRMSPRTATTFGRRADCIGERRACQRAAASWKRSSSRSASSNRTARSGLKPALAGSS